MRSRATKPHRSCQDAEAEIGFLRDKNDELFILYRKEVSARDAAEARVVALEAELAAVKATAAAEMARQFDAYVEALRQARAANPTTEESA